MISITKQIEHIFSDTWFRIDLSLNTMTPSHNVLPERWPVLEQLLLQPVEMKKVALSTELRYVWIYSRCLISSQVLQYNETAETWSVIGRMEKARVYHAVVEADVALFCPGFVGQTNRKPSSQSPSSPTPQYHHIHHHLLIIPTVSLLPKRFVV